MLIDLTVAECAFVHGIHHSCIHSLLFMYCQSEYNLTSIYYISDQVSSHSKLSSSGAQNLQLLQRIVELIEQTPLAVNTKKSLVHI